MVAPLMLWPDSFQRRSRSQRGVKHLYHPRETRVAGGPSHAEGFQILHTIRRSLTSKGPSRVR